MYKHIAGRLDKKVNYTKDTIQEKQVSSSRQGAPFVARGREVDPKDVLTLQRMIGNGAVQQVFQLGRKKDLDGNSNNRKKEKGSRRTEKKGGKKSQRDKRPGIMSDPILGDIFIDFWHGFKQKHGGKLADYTGDRMLRMTLNDLTQGTSESEHANQTLHWFFSRFLEERHPELYQELLDNAEHEDYHNDEVKDNDSDEDDDDFGGLGSGGSLGSAITSY
ncbi:hypothetical protein [Bacillus horti]|uniref:Uncharacterized protein n=1 Tax=Caldalkalibacillus horti TaxID=77523 RepID=A0ABT9W0P7_9BACI|nr:hypothetical protein [Bacillus horti]MDQ0166801.1 hypothetical protein [Bacillus horti]